MSEQEETWQTRIRELYSNVEELYSHVEVTIVVFDRNLRVDAEAHKQDPPSISASLVPALTDIARRVLENGQSVRDVPLDLTGRRRAHAHALRQAGEIVGVACVVEDDSARRELFVRCALAIFDGYRENEAALLAREQEALEEARRANRLRDQFMAMISHELRGPLSAILLWEHVLRDDALDNVTRARALDAIHECASAQMLLVADLIDVSRAINGKLHLDRRVVSIERVLMAAIDRARPSADARGLMIVAELDPNSGHVLGDPHRLHQIFENLLSNAIKCTDHGQISVRARQVEQTIVIDVDDTGQGIAEEFLPHIFDAFSQDEGFETRGGLGLGLAISRQLVDLHGGTLAARSDGPGRGATFTVSLPCLNNVPRENESPSQTTAERQLDGVRILAIDDDPRVLEALRLLFCNAGAVVVTAQSAAAGYDVLQRERIDILLSDISMPGEDGCSFLRRVRGTTTMCSIPAIAITSHVAEDERRRILAAGFDHCVTKPIDVPLLVSYIAQLVTSRSLRRD